MINISKKSLVSFMSEWLTLNKDVSLEDINVTDNVFLAGFLDSLSMFRLLFDVETQFNIEINQEDYFQIGAVSLESFAQAIMVVSKPVNHDL